MSGDGPGTGAAGAASPIGATSAARPPRTLRLLVADDERPALDELLALLDADPRVGELVPATTGSQALRILSDDDGIDAAVLDIHMPGLSGLDLARALTRFERRPPVVFVTADDESAVDAFDLEAVDYVLKPVRVERLARAIGRLVDAVTDARSDGRGDVLGGGAAAGAGAAGGAGGAGAAGGAGGATGSPATDARNASPTATNGEIGAGPVHPADDVIAVTLGTTTRMVRRDAIKYAEAQGDYVRLHTAEGGFLVRVPLGELEERWAAAGFVRVHRSYLVALAHVTRLQLAGAGSTVTVGATALPVSRRALPGLRERLDELRVRRG